MVMKESRSAKRAKNEAARLFPWEVAVSSQGSRLGPPRPALLPCKCTAAPRSFRRSKNELWGHLSRDGTLQEVQLERALRAEQLPRRHRASLGRARGRARYGALPDLDAGPARASEPPEGRQGSSPSCRPSWSKDDTNCRTRAGGGAATIQQNPTP
jgi:hypothetical protein